jgi:tRNA(Ile)-lysidine synthase
MLQEFKKSIEENKLVYGKNRILMAVSGGIDSMVMIHLFIAAGISPAIAHCNFNLRGKESDLDEAFVKGFAAKNKIPFHTVSFDTTGYAEEKGISIQMAARELRYRWFEEVRVEHGYESIALAHNLNDNVETFLINLTRGTGIAGLTGMRPRFNYLIRPLLFASRKAITDYSVQNKIKFREDRTNSDVKYVRNKIRHTILPLLRELNPSFDVTITETAERFSEINEIVTSYISGIRRSSAVAKDNMLTFSASDLKKVYPGKTVLFELFRPYGLASAQIDELIKIIKSRSGHQLLTKTHRITKNRNEILVTELDRLSEYHYQAGTLRALKKVPGIVSAEIKDVGKGFKIPLFSSIACLDAEKIGFPLTVRKWTSGDFFYPLGMRSKKKLSDYFIDEKYSLPEKERQLILESAGKIIWVIGERIDNRYKITPETKKALIIKFSREFPDL